MDETWVKTYCRRAGVAFDCGKAGNTAFEGYLRTACTAILAEQPDAEPAALEALLGAPEQLAADFLDTLPPGTVAAWRAYYWRRQRLMMLLVAAMIVLLLALTVLFLLTRGVVLIEKPTVYMNYASFALKGLRILTQT